MTTDALVTRKDAAAALGILESEVADAVAGGTLREVYHRSTPEASLESFIVGADVDRLLGGANGAMNAAIRERAFRGRRRPDETIDMYLRRRGAR